MKYNESLKVLVVEDNPLDRRMLESMLTGASDTIQLVKSVESLAGALEALSITKIDVVILDLNLTDSHGEETLLKLSSRCPDVAVVINTGAYEDELGLETLSYGAQDFLIKGKYTAYVLNKALRYAVERKRVQLELITAYNKLKEAQAQLIQSEKMKVVGGLASGVAHEVKNPLATILYGITYLGQKYGEGDAKLTMTLENMKQAISKANNIVTDLLNFASLTSLNKKEEDLNEVVEAALSLLCHEFARNHVAVVKELEENLQFVTVDRNRIEQVMINLILNAIFAMPEGGIVKIKTFSRVLSEDLEDLPQLRRDRFMPGETLIVLIVEDAGCGIPEDKIDKIFDPFFTTRRANGGVGLGLSVSKNIMDIHEGSIFVENRHDGGVRATLIFKAGRSQREVVRGQEQDLNCR